MAQNSNNNGKPSYFTGDDDMFGDAKPTNNNNNNNTVKTEPGADEGGSSKQKGRKGAPVKRGGEKAEPEPEIKLSKEQFDYTIARKRFDPKSAHVLYDLTGAVFTKDEEKQLAAVYIDVKDDCGGDRKDNDRTIYKTEVDGDDLWNVVGEMDITSTSTQSPKMLVNRVVRDVAQYIVFAEVEGEGYGHYTIHLNDPTFLRVLAANSPNLLQKLMQTIITAQDEHGYFAYETRNPSSGNHRTFYVVTGCNDEHVKLLTWAASHNHEAPKAEDSAARMFYFKDHDQLNDEVFSKVKVEWDTFNREPEPGVPKKDDKNEEEEEELDCVTPYNKPAGDGIHEEHIEWGVYLHDHPDEENTSVFLWLSLDNAFVTYLNLPANKTRYAEINTLLDQAHMRQEKDAEARRLPDNSVSLTAAFEQRRENANLHGNAVVMLGSVAENSLSERRLLLEGKTHFQNTITALVEKLQREHKPKEAALQQYVAETVKDNLLLTYDTDDVLEKLYNANGINSNVYFTEYPLYTEEMQVPEDDDEGEDEDDDDDDDDRGTKKRRTDADEGPSAAHARGRSSEPVGHATSGGGLVYVNRNMLAKLKAYILEVGTKFHPQPYFDEHTSVLYDMFKRDFVVGEDEKEDAVIVDYFDQDKVYEKYRRRRITVMYCKDADLNFMGIVAMCEHEMFGAQVDVGDGKKVSVNKFNILHYYTNIMSDFWPPRTDPIEGDDDNDNDPLQEPKEESKYLQTIQEVYSFFVTRLCIVYNKFFAGVTREGKWWEVNVAYPPFLAINKSTAAYPLRCGPPVAIRNDTAVYSGGPGSPHVQEGISFMRHYMSSLRNIVEILENIRAGFVYFGLTSREPETPMRTIKKKAEITDVKVTDLDKLEDRPEFSAFQHLIRSHKSNLLQRTVGASNIQRRVRALWEKAVAIQNTVMSGMERKRALDIIYNDLKDLQMFNLPPDSLNLTDGFMESIYKGIVYTGGDMQLTVETSRAILFDTSLQTWIKILYQLLVYTKNPAPMNTPCPLSDARDFYVEMATEFEDARKFFAWVRKTEGMDVKFPNIRNLPDNEWLRDAFYISDAQREKERQMRAERNARLVNRSNNDDLTAAELEILKALKMHNTVPANNGSSSSSSSSSSSASSSAAAPQQTLRMSILPRNVPFGMTNADVQQSLDEAEYFMKLSDSPKPHATTQQTSMRPYTGPFTVNVEKKNNNNDNNDNNDNASQKRKRDAF